MCMLRAAGTVGVHTLAATCVSGWRLCGPVLSTAKQSLHMALSSDSACVNDERGVQLCWLVEC